MLNPAWHPWMCERQFKERVRTRSTKRLSGLKLTILGNLNEIEVTLQNQYTVQYLSAHRFPFIIVYYMRSILL